MGCTPLSLPSDKTAQLLRRHCIYSEDQEEKFQDVIRRFVHWYGMDDDWSLYLDYFPDTPAWTDERWQSAGRCARRGFR